MNDRELLLTQARATLREVRRLPVVLVSERIDARLRERVESRFKVTIEDKVAQLNSLIKKVEDNGDVHEAWSGLQLLRLETAPLFREFLAFVHGALFRSAALDEGLCDLGDALAAELNRSSGTDWKGLTVMAWEGESYNDLAELIRIRSPEVSMWSLPVIAHEFGHFAAQSLAERINGNRYYRVKEYLAKKKQADARAARHLDEQFADLYAAYTLGPAYACTCVILRFDPATAFQPGPLHPSPDDRVYWILKVLKKSDEEGGLVRQYTEIIDRLTAEWSTNIQAAGQQSPAVADRSLLDERFTEMFEILDRLVPDDAQYQGWLRAATLSRSLDPVSDAGLKVGSEDRVADVLNAAWLCRLRQPSDEPASVRIIGERAATLCRQIIARQSRR